MVSSRQPQGALYYPTLDGWRGVSIVLVLLAHSTLLFPEPFWPLHTRQLSVDVFFTISGFLITSLLVEEVRQRGAVSLRAFYLRRASRIFPAQLCYLGVVALLWQWDAVQTSWKNLLGSAFFVRNFFLGDWVTRQCWSLSIEEQFYFLWPLTLALVARSRKFFTVALVLVGTLAIWNVVDAHWGIVQGWPERQRSFLTDMRLFPIFGGAIFAIAMRDQRCRVWIERMPVGSLPAFVAFVLLYFVERRGVLLRLAVAPPLIVILLHATMHAPHSAVGRFLESKALIWLGRRSYGLYLWQQLFLIPPGSHPFLPWGGFYAVLTAWFVAPILAMISYAVLERPALRWGRRASDRILGRTAVSARPIGRAA